VGKQGRGQGIPPGLGFPVCEQMEKVRQVSSGTSAPFIRLWSLGPGVEGGGGHGSAGLRNQVVTPGMGTVYHEVFRGIFLLVRKAR
jgi:hypothetical protein